MSRVFRKMVDTVLLNKTSFVGVALCVYMSRRVNRNMQELEQNTQDKKLFDPLKAKAQIEVYKEIYNIGDDNSQESKDKKDNVLKILQSASENDMEKINKFFEKSADQDQSEIEREMDKLKKEIDSLEEVNSTHQGFKFYRTVMTKDTFEDALIELREKQFEKKFRKDKEDLVGTTPKII
eukprot:403340221